MKENLLKIFNRLREEGIANVSVKNTLHRGNVEVAFWYIPFCFDTGEHRPEYDYKKEIKLANNLYRMAGLPDLEQEEIQNIMNGLGYMMMSFDFSIRKQVGLLKELPITFSIYIDSDENLYFTYCDKPVGGTYLDAFKNMKPFTLEMATEDELFYYETMLQLSEAVCNELEITTEQNQGVFHKTTISDQQAFDELVSLLNHDGYLSEADLAELKTDWQNINENREAFARRLISEGVWFEEDLEYLDDYQTDYLLYWAFVEKLNVHRDDWKFGVKELCQFISEKINQPFKMTFKEVGNDWEIVRDKLELLSNYTLLDLRSGNDDCNFIIAKKQDKQRIYHLADQIGLWIE